MRWKSIGSYRPLVALTVAALAAVAMFALAASNTVPGTKAGQGSNTITGYVVSNVQYVLNATNPANIDSVTFTLDATATTVKAKLQSAATSYHACSNTGGNNWSCATTSPQETVSGANELAVIAVA